MTKNTPSHWVTGISRITEEDLLIRGYPMAGLVERKSFSEIAYLLIRGELPSSGQARMFDFLLTSVLDYGLEKSGTVAARMVASVNPQMPTSLAAGVAAAGEFALSPEPTGDFILKYYGAWRESGRPLEPFVADLVADMRARKERVPGFGHQVFRGVDPRAQTLKRIAQECGIWGDVNVFHEALHAEFKAATNKPDLVLNDVGMLAGIMIQMGFTPKEMAGIALLSTFPGLIAHVSEELRSGVRCRIVGRESVDYVCERRELPEGD